MPESKHLYYREGYKYQTELDHTFETGILVGKSVGNIWVILWPTGEMFVKKGYAFDGPSGPTFDTKDFMRGACAHDAAYQLLREGHIHQHHRKTADKLLYRMCVEDGMSLPMAKIVYLAVRKFGASSAALGSSKPVLVAP